MDWRDVSDLVGWCLSICCYIRPNGMSVGGPWIPIDRIHPKEPAQGIGLVNIYFVDGRRRKKAENKRKGDV